MQPRAWSAAWRKGGWIRRLSGTTCSPSTAQRGVEQWIASLRGSPANPGAGQETASAPTTSGGSGRRSPASVTRRYRRAVHRNPGTSSWRTLLGSQTAAGSTSSSATLRASGSMRRGICFDRKTLGPRTPGHGSSYWEGAVVVDHGARPRLGWRRRHLGGRGLALQRRPARRGDPFGRRGALPDRVGDAAQRHGALADADLQRRAECGRPGSATATDLGGQRSHRRAIGAGVRRVDDGDPTRLDRLRMLGNGVDPLAAGFAFATLSARMDGR